jgi:nucleotide-binding universal stress UspA family protein
MARSTLDAPATSPPSSRSSSVPPSRSYTSSRYQRRGRSTSTRRSRGRDSGLVDDAVRDLKDRGIDAIGELRLPNGSVAHEIIDLAKEIDPSLIVMGSRGLSDGEALLLGSVSHKVAHFASCPVLVVR